jgi:hypothetical protein
MSSDDDAVTTMEDSTLLIIGGIAVAAVLLTDNPLTKGANLVLNPLQSIEKSWQDSPNQDNSFGQWMSIPNPINLYGILS